jgi:hypothetical protein
MGKTQPQRHCISDCALKLVTVVTLDLPAELETKNGIQDPRMEFKIKNNITHFSFLRGEHAYYTVAVEGANYICPANLADLGGASIFAEMKAITMMHYIRKALADGSFVKCK